MKGKDIADRGVTARKPRQFQPDKTPFETSSKLHSANLMNDAKVDTRLQKTKFRSNVL